MKQSLKKDGVFLFSVMHRLFMACRPQMPSDKNHGGNCEIKNYLKNGKRECDWLGITVVKCYHLFTDYLMVLLKNSFKIIEVCEPKLAKKHQGKDKKLDQFAKNPAFLIIKAKS